MRYYAFFFFFYPFSLACTVQNHIPKQTLTISRTNNYIVRVGLMQSTIFFRCQFNWEKIIHWFIVEKPKPVCRQPKVVGPCKAYIPRYWYNKRTNQCERFIYGGCQGNQNNFETIEECERRCKRRDSCKFYVQCIDCFRLKLISKSHLQQLKV